MKKYFMLAVISASAMLLTAQSVDPVLMTINGKEVKRSEFEYALNKNNTTLGEDKKAIEDYLPMYIDFKLKVAEAETQKLDTLSSFIEELQSNRAQLAESYLIDNDYIEREAHKVYAQDSATIGKDGFLRVSHLFIQLQQQATENDVAAAKARMDSAYSALQNGATLADAAKVAGVHPGMIQPFEIIRGQTYKEFEETAYALADSAFSQPFRSPAGYHIVMRYGKRAFGEYSEYRDAIVSMLEKRGVRNVARLMKGRALAREMGGNLTAEEALAREDSLLEVKYPDFGNLMTEYHDGLLFFEICTREVWNKASEDETGLEKYFKKNKKKYIFQTPRFRGAVVYANSQEDIDKARTLLLDAPLDKYRDIIQDNFYVDSAYVIRVEMGVFSIGDNAWVDKKVFGQGDGGKLKRGFELVDVIGVELEKPQTYKDVKGAVVNDYQKYIEEKWVKKLRKKYKVEINKEVLKTVNNHE